MMYRSVRPDKLLIRSMKESNGFLSNIEPLHLTLETDSPTITTESLIFTAKDVINNGAETLVRVGAYLNDCVGHFGGWDDRKGVHDSVRVFFSDF